MGAMCIGHSRCMSAPLCNPPVPADPLHLCCSPHLVGSGGRVQRAQLALPSKLKQAVADAVADHQQRKVHDLKRGVLGGREGRGWGEAMQCVCNKRRSRQMQQTQQRAPWVSCAQRQSSRRGCLQSTPLKPCTSGPSYTTAQNAAQAHLGAAAHDGKALAERAALLLLLARPRFGALLGDGAVLAHTPPAAPSSAATMQVGVKVNEWLGALLK